LGAGLAPRRFMSLRRAASVDRRKLGRRPPATETYPDPPATSGSDGTRTVEKQPPLPPVAKEDPGASTSLAQRTKSLGHARRESIQARRARREARENDVKEETDAEVVAASAAAAAAAEAAESSHRHHKASSYRARSEHGAESGEGEGEAEPLKPVYLKGLFSVSTTSTKKLSFIQADIIRVLKQLNVDYTEIKGGFECRHKPSIAATPGPVNPTSNPAASPVADPREREKMEKTHTRKTSFGTLKNLAANAAGYINTEKEQTVRSPKTPRREFNSGNNNSPSGVSDTESDSGAYGHNSRSKDAGTTSTHVRDEFSNSQALEFEIFIVKVPFLSLHGIQFKKVDGNIMVYKEMAQEILQRLKL
jgi:serine/threonine protein kinase KIN1/2